MENNNEVWSFKPADLFTIPNILTYIRILLTIPFAYFFIKEDFVSAALCIAFSGLSDCFDGLIARKFNMVTSLGKILDPIADKLTLIITVICMVIKVPQSLPVLIIFLIKDIAMLIGGTNLIKKGLTPPAAKWYGKAATVLFYFSICIIIFLEAVFDIQIYTLDFILLVISAAAMLFALYKYAKIYFAMIKEYNNKH